MFSKLPCVSRIVSGQEFGKPGSVCIHFADGPPTNNTPKTSLAHLEFCLVPKQTLTCAHCRIYHKFPTCCSFFPPPPTFLLSRTAILQFFSYLSTTNTFQSSWLGTNQSKTPKFPDACGRTIPSNSSPTSKKLARPPIARRAAPLSPRVLVVVVRLTALDT
jgi:hypothetical protein